MTKTLSYLEFLGLYTKVASFSKKYLQRDFEDHWFPCPSLVFSSCEVIGQLGHVPEAGGREAEG